MNNIGPLEGSALINIQYGVCFGSIFSSTFVYVDDGVNSSIEVALRSDRLAPYLFLIAYFFLDWLSANFLRERYAFTISRIMLWSMAIWLLGFSIIIVNSKDIFGIVGILFYMIVVSLYRIMRHRDELTHLKNVANFVVIIASLLMFLISVLLVTYFFIEYYYLVPISKIIVDIFLCATVALVFLKALIVVLTRAPSSTEQG